MKRSTVGAIVGGLSVLVGGILLWKSGDENGYEEGVLERITNDGVELIDQTEEEA